MYVNRRRGHHISVMTGGKNWRETGGGVGISFAGAGNIWQVLVVM